MSPSLTPEAPPNKRAKRSPPTPNTIAERLTTGTYTSLNPILADIGAVCRSLLAAAANNNPPDSALTSESEAQQDVIPLVAQIVHFEEFARAVITRERSRRADLFDFADEFTGEEGARVSATGGKVALTVMGHHGPLFSSLQNPIAVPAPHRTEALSRSSSISESPSSTAPTSTATSPKNGPLKVYRVIAPLNESVLPPLISTVKAASSDAKSSLKRGIEAEKVLTLAEAFPPSRSHTLPPPKPYPANKPPAIGLKWGGIIAPGGISAPNSSFTRPDPTGEWLSYRNHPPRDSKYRPRRGEPIRLGMGLPADFVVAYSSFAPTRDDAGAKVPTQMRNRVWWERRGGELFGRMFKHDPGVGHMFSEYEKRGAILAEVVVDDTDAMQIDADDGEDEEEVFRKAVESWEPDSDVPIDFRLLDGSGGEEAPQETGETLKEISGLLQSLRSHQYVRLSALPPVSAPRITTDDSAVATTPVPVGPTPLEPTPEEIALYNTIKTRLATLIASLPPHLTSTIDGTIDAPLNVSTKIPIFEGGAPIYKGTLPDDPKPGQPSSLGHGHGHGQAVQGAAMAALNAAVGMSPMSPVPPPPGFSAPTAMMSSTSSGGQHHHQRMNVPVPAPPTPGRLPGVPHVQTYHGHHMPSTPQSYAAPQQFHAHQMPTPSVTTPHHYPSPYAPAPFPATPPPPRVVGREETRAVAQQFHAHSMPPATATTPTYGVYANYPPSPRRLNVPPPQGLAAIGVGVVQYSGRHMQGQDELRMGVQHTQSSMENGTVPGGRYAGRSRR